jgi:hypothetical protein
MRIHRLLSLALLASPPLLAEDVPAVYEMSVIEDAAQGHRMTEGDFSNAIEKINAPRLFKSTTFAMSNNLCVAYTMTMKFKEAEQACDAALSARDKVRFPARWYNSFVKRTTVRDKAMALSNRGVLRAVTGDAAGARADFESAIGLESALDSARANLTRLDAKTLQAASAQKNDR